MLIHGFNDHYRSLQKNLFLGESLRVFTNGGQGGNIPVPDAMLGGGAPEERITIPASRMEAAARKNRFFQEMIKMVPEQTEHRDEAHLQIQEEWTQVLSDYNGIQSYIDYLVKVEKDLNDVNLVQDPRFRSRYASIYADLLRLANMEHLHLNVDAAAIRRRMADQSQLTTHQILADLRRIIDQLKEERMNALRVVMDRVKRDFARRLNRLREQWQNNCPPGYEAHRGDWITYCNNVQKVINGLPDFDSNRDDFPSDPPNVSRVFTALKEWWSYLTHIEDSYRVYSEGQRHELSADSLRSTYNDVNALRERTITGNFSAQVDRQIDEVTGPLQEVISLFESRIAGIRDDDEKKKKLGELEGLRTTLKNLQGSKNIKKHFEDAFTSNEPMATATKAGKSVPIPRGLRGQIDFIMGDIPFSDVERRHMMSGIRDALQKAKEEITDAESYYTRALPNILQKVNLFRNELEAQTPKQEWSVMWLPVKGSAEEVSHTISELFTRAYKRDVGRKTGIAGHKLFESIGPDSIPGKLLSKFEMTRPVAEISGEMDIHREHAETEDYQHYMKVHEHASLEHMVHVMHNTPNPFEFRGVVELICKKGRMRFYDDEDFFRQLNRFQRVINVRTSKYWHLDNRVDSQDAVRRAINAIFKDPDIYRNWTSQNASSLESEKGNKKKILGELSESDAGLLGTRLDGILKEYKDDKANPNKHFSEADPIEYEAVITYAIEQGKLNGEDALYYLIQGIGHGLLAHERGSEYTGMNNQYPSVEIFSQGRIPGFFEIRGSKPTLQDVEEWALMDYQHYLYFYHSKVMYLPKVRERLNKALTQGLRLDHDYFTAYAGSANPQTMESLLKESHDGYRLQVTAVQNGAVGRLMSFDCLMSQYYELGEVGKESLTRFVDAQMRFDGILRGRMYAGKPGYQRLDQTSLHREHPRYGGFYESFFGRQENSTSYYMETVRNHLRVLDFDPNFKLLNRLIDGNFASDTDALNFAVRMKEKYPKIFEDKVMPKTIDGLYEFVGPYIDYIIKNNPNRVVDTMVRNVRREHAAWATGQEAKRKDREQLLTLQNHIDKTHRAQAEYREELRRRAVRGQLEEEHHGGHAAHDAGRGHHGAHGAGDDTHGADGTHGVGGDEGHDAGEGHDHEEGGGREGHGGGGGTAVMGGGFPMNLP